MALGKMKIKEGMIFSVRQNVRDIGDGWNWKYIEYKHLFYIGIKDDDHMFLNIETGKQLGWFEDILYPAYDYEDDKPHFSPFKKNNKARYNADWKLVSNT
jgi:hypothetical protein